MNLPITLLLTIFIFTSSLPDADQVKVLNGYYDFSKDFQMFSGYLTLQQAPLINVHYIFLTSQSNPASDDVVLWLNGGPGCSSLLGFAQELGPQLLNQGADAFSPYKNPYSWNARTNLLFLESPPGVGFSVNKDPTYQHSDPRTASDNLKALQEWYKKFPQFSKNKFWISGQSYCGMYIPLFADQVLKNKDKIVVGGNLNFQGILIGNGVMLTELHWRRQARNTFYSNRYFYGPQIQNLIAACRYNSSDDTSAACTMGNRLADQAVQRVNPYASTGICYQHNSGVSGKPRSRFWYTPFDQEMYSQKTADPGCSSDDSGITKFFNDKKVQEQLHVDTSIIWESCNEVIGSTFKKDLTTIQLFENFKKNGLKVLLYSGNTDAQVSYIETEEYIKKIGWKQTSQKVAIVNKRESLMGWVTEYEGLTFYVINGAGHMVPSDKPHAAQEMLHWFLSKA